MPATRTEYSYRYSSSANGKIIRAFARLLHPVEFGPSSTMTYAGKEKKVIYPLHHLPPRYSLEQGRA